MQTVVELYGRTELDANVDDFNLKCIFLSHNSQIPTDDPLATKNLTFKTVGSFSCFDLSRKGPVIKKWICAKSGSLDGRTARLVGTTCCSGRLGTYLGMV